MINFCLLITGSIAAWLWRPEKLKPMERLINALLCFGIALIAYELLFPITKDTADWIQWGYSLGCGILSFGISEFLRFRGLSLKHFLWLYGALAAIVYGQRLFYQALNAQEILAVRIASAPFGDLLVQAARNMNPPLYFILLKGWISLFSQSALSLLVFGLLPFAGVLWVSWELLGKKQLQAWLLFTVLLLFLPISLSASYYLWGYMACAMFGVAGTLLLFQSVQKNSLMLLGGSILCLVLSSWFHFGGLIVCAIDGLAYLIYQISQKKIVSSLLYLVVLAANALVLVWITWPHLLVNTAPKDLSEMQSAFLYLVSTFSGWQDGQFPYLFLVVFVTAIFGYALDGKDKKKIASFWFYTLAISTPIAIFSIVWAYARFIRYWRSLELLNSSFVGFDAVLWLGLALLIASFRSRKIFAWCMGLFLMIGAFNCNRTMGDEFTAYTDITFAQRFIRQYTEPGRKIIVSNYRGIIGYDSEDIRLLTSWYFPDQVTGQLEGQNLKDMDYDARQAVVLSEEKLTKGLKQILDEQGYEWIPLGYITMPGDIDMYVYIFE